MRKWGFVLVIVFNMHAMFRYARQNGQLVTENDIEQLTDFVKRNGEYQVVPNEIVAVFFKNKWIYAQVLDVPSRQSNHVGLLARSKSLKFYKNFPLDFKNYKYVKKLPKEINELNA